MEIVKTIKEVRTQVKRARTEGKSIGFVPTMGALHIGHASLIKAACTQCDFVVVSIFVNPTQFAPTEDLEAYPRPFDQDCGLCQAHGAALVFAPEAGDMYPDEGLTWVQVSQLTTSLCGASRPNHFQGVTTVCTKLFNIVLPDVAFFGQKDAQQALVIQRMVADLNMPLQIQVCPTVREPDGLAVSSRNKYLNEIQREQAPCLYQALQWCESQIAEGTREVADLVKGMQDHINQMPDTHIDYISIVDSHSLETLDQVRGTVLVALAVQLGPARLIDNILIDVIKS